MPRHMRPRCPETSHCGPKGIRYPCVDLRKRPLERVGMCGQFRGADSDWPSRHEGVAYARRDARSNRKRAGWGARAGVAGLWTGPQDHVEAAAACPASCNDAPRKGVRHLKHATLAAALVLLVACTTGATIPPPPTTTVPPTSTLPPSVDTPDVTGMTLADAKTVIRDDGLMLSVTKKPSNESVGTVLAQDPSSGTSVDVGTAVSLTVAVPLP